MTPKSLLRHKRAVSRLDEMAADSTFHRLLYDDAEMLEGQAISLVPDARIRRVVVCSGKVYFDLYEEREKRGIDDIYILRVEQLYPFPLKAMGDCLARFPAADIVWCQEEPQNMGAWTFAAPRIAAVLGDVGMRQSAPAYAGRRAAASPATGLYRQHVKGQATLIEAAITGGEVAGTS
jgi:2-oxoglutarate dehydrogenase E1 component